MNYSLTKEEVEAYLEERRLEDEVGVSCDINHCLLANVVREKYPELFDVQVCEDGIFAFRGYRSSFQRVMTMTPELEEVMEIMDFYTEEEECITKEGFLRARALYYFEEGTYAQAA